MNQVASAKILVPVAPIKVVAAWKVVRMARFILETDLIHPDGSSVEKDHPSSINTGRTVRRTISVSCDSSRVL